MKMMNQLFLFNVMNGLVALLTLLSVVSCATNIPELQIKYALPPSSDQLEGRAVALTIQDRRADKSILGKGAKEEFKRFSNSISLSIAEPNQKGSSIGIFQVPPLMREAFTIRLARSGMKVLSDKTAVVPSLVIVVKEFSLDLVGSEWMAKMSYEARLSGEKGAVATQFINGKAERYKVIGRDSADALMSEIFTDMVNSLNLTSLFDQIGL